MINDQVIQIIGLLIQKMLKNHEITLGEEEIIQELLEMGYDIQAIDEAFELIYNSTDIIEAENINGTGFERVSSYNRVFTLAERLYLPLNIQGLFRKLIQLNLLTPREYEEIIIRTIQDSLIGLSSSRHLWSIIKEVIEDQQKLDMISLKINEFKNLIPSDFKYIN